MLLDGSSFSSDTHVLNCPSINAVRSHPPSTADASNKPMPCLAIPSDIQIACNLATGGNYGSSGTFPTLPLDQSSRPGTDILLLANVLLEPVVLPTWHLSQASMVMLWPKKTSPERCRVVWK